MPFKSQKIGGRSNTHVPTGSGLGLWGEKEECCKISWSFHLMVPMGHSFEGDDTQGIPLSFLHASRTTFQRVIPSQHSDSNSLPRNQQCPSVRSLALGFSQPGHAGKPPLPHPCALRKEATSSERESGTGYIQACWGRCRDQGSLETCRSKTPGLR